MSKPSYFGDSYLIEETLADVRLWVGDELLASFQTYQSALRYLRMELEDTGHLLPIYHRMPEGFGAVGQVLEQS